MVLMVEVLTRIGFCAVKEIKVSIHDFQEGGFMEHVRGAIRSHARIIDILLKKRRWTKGSEVDQKYIPPQGCEVRHEVTQASFLPQLLAH